MKGADKPMRGPARVVIDDDAKCSKCGSLLDTGLECTECGHDMMPELSNAQHPAPGPAQGVTDFVWLVELRPAFADHPPFQATYYAGYMEGPEGARTTDPHAAPRFVNKTDAERVAQKLGHTLSCVWQAVEHGFSRPTTLPAGEAVAWQGRCHVADEGWSDWCAIEPQQLEWWRKQTRAMPLYYQLRKAETGPAAEMCHRSTVPERADASQQECISAPRVQQAWGEVRGDAIYSLRFNLRKATLSRGETLPDGTLLYIHPAPAAPSAPQQAVARAVKRFNLETREASIRIEPYPEHVPQPRQEYFLAPAEQPGREGLSRAQIKAAFLDRCRLDILNLICVSQERIFELGVEFAHKHYGIATPTERGTAEKGSP